MGGQRQTALALSPPWLQYGAAAGEKGGVGGPFMYNLGLAQDILLDKAYQGVQARMPGKGTYTALPYIGNDRVLVQGPAEPDAHFAIRCKRAFLTWSFAGAPRGKLENLVGYLTGLSSPRPYVLQVNNSGTWHWYAPTDDETAAPEHFDANNWDWDGSSTSWWRIWVVIGNGPWVKKGIWGDGSKWGADPANPQLGYNGAWGPVVGTPLTGNTGQVVAASNASPIVIATASPHGLTTADKVYVEGVQGNSAANGYWTVTVLSGQFFSLNGSTGSGSYVTGGQVYRPTTAGPASFVRNSGPPAWWPQAQGWGSTATAAEVLAIRTIIATWKGAHAYVPAVIIRLNDSHLGPYNAPGAPMPDGTWKNFGKDVAGAYVPARDQTARYWTQVI